MSLFKAHIKLILLCLVMLISVIGFGQQDAMYSNYRFNALVVNPAYAGSKYSMSALLLTRNQWTGIEGAPETHNFTIHTPIPKKNIGLGFSFIQDKIGPLSSLSFSGNFAYTIRLRHDGSRISFGLKGGINTYTLGLSKLKTIQSGDSKFEYDIKGEINPSIGVGIYLFDKNYYFGLSVPDLIQNKINQNNGVENNTVYKKNTHIYTMAGYVFKVNDNFHVEPSYCLRYVKGTPLSYDFTSLMIFYEKLYLGATYRSEKSVGVLSKIDLNKQMSVGLAYDFTLSDLSGYAGNTYEIMLVYDFNYVKKTLYDCPVFF